MKVAGENRRFLLDTTATTILNLKSFASGESKQVHINSWSGITAARFALSINKLIVSKFRGGAAGGSRIQLVFLEDIEWIRGAGNYPDLHGLGRCHLLRENLDAREQENACALCACMDMQSSLCLFE